MFGWIASFIRTVIEPAHSVAARIGLLSRVADDDTANRSRMSFSDVTGRNASDLDAATMSRPSHAESRSGAASY
jgi:hypothetical protein